MAKLVFFILAAALAVVAMSWFLGDWTAESSLSEPRIEGRRGDPREGPMLPRRAEEVRAVAEKVEDLPRGEVSEGRGALLVEAALEESLPGELRIAMTPPAGSWDRLATGFRNDDVAPGLYRLTLWGGDIVPIATPAVEVQEGRLTRLAFDLARGVRPKGRVVLAIDGSPLPGAEVDFGGMARVVSDEAGRFACEQLVPRHALSTITVTKGGDWDRQVYKGLVISDPDDMTLALGGGQGTVVGEILNVSGRPDPERCLLRVTIPPLYQVRREVALEGSDTFRIENLYETEYRVELHFPQGEFPVAHHRVSLTTSEPVAQVRFVLEGGCLLRGKMVGPEILLPGLGVELRNIRNEVVASCEADDEGRYALAGLSPGLYFPHVRSAGGTWHLPELEIAEGEREMVRDIDVLRHRFID